MTNTALQKQISITNLVPENSFIQADPNMIETVIRNLFSNAIKFTASGGEVSISIHENEKYNYGYRYR